jgi:hypothetical protein
MSSQEAKSENILLKNYAMATKLFWYRTRYQQWTISQGTMK